MQAVLTGPIVTDYVPVARPPWMILAFAIAILAFVVPREVLPEFLLGSTLAAGIGWAINWWCGRSETRSDPPAAGG